MILAIASLLFASPVAAETSSTTRYLMHEPVSMLTYGLGEINHELEEEKKSIIFIISDKGETINPESFDLGASYDYDNDTIIVIANCINCGMSVVDESKCAEIIKILRQYAYINEDGAMTVKSNPFTVTFHQFGYINSDEPNNIDNEIAKKIQIHVDLFKAGAEIKCEAPLLGKGYSIKH